MSNVEVVFGGPRIPPNHTEIYRVSLKKGEIITFKEQVVVSLCLMSGKVRMRNYDINVKKFDANSKSARKNDQTVTINVTAGPAVVFGNDEPEGTVATFRVFWNMSGLDMLDKEKVAYNNMLSS